MSAMAATRRELLAGALAAAAAFGCKSKARRSPEPAEPQRKSPRYLVLLQLSGGPDGVLTLDPKDPSEVESWVDNPLHRDNVSAGAIRLGAQFAPLAKWAPNMAIVQGVRVDTVNHVAGAWQINRLRRRVSHTMPTLLDIIADHRPEQPLGALTLGDLLERAFSPRWAFDGFPFYPGQRPVPQGLAPFERMEAKERALLAQALRDNARDASLRPADRANYERVAAVLDRLATATKFEPQDWSVKSPRARLFAATGNALQRVLWGLENDLISGAFVMVTRNEWDSHFDNLARQTASNDTFVQMFERFLQQLFTRRNAHGVLAENTTIVIAGELGRYPRINSDHGKDHYPEMPMLLMGAGIKGGQMIGQTGKDMLAVPVDNATGALRGSRHLVLDDVGTTLLRLFGVEPTRYGYTGLPVEPLLA
jgi:uncharacterized protein (DUF1501 family)